MSLESFSEREGLERLDILFREEKFDEASAFASDLRDSFPASFQIGFLYYKILVSLNKYSESENVLDDLLRQYPENINLLLVKGELLIGRGKVAESKLFFDRVLFLDPFNSRAKEGAEKAKKESSDFKVEFANPKKVRSGLEDTMKEEDLERFMDKGTDPSLSEVEFEGELDISITETEMEFENSLEGGKSSFSVVSEKTSENEVKNIPNISDRSVEIKGEVVAEVSENILPVSDKVTFALEKLESFSLSDENDSEIRKDLDVEEMKESETGDEFVTESAALLYLKQGLYDDADSVYAKLYKGSNDLLYKEKLEKIKRIKIANLKIKALESFLKRINTGSVRIV